MEPVSAKNDSGLSKERALSAPAQDVVSHVLKIRCKGTEHDNSARADFLEYRLTFENNLLAKVDLSIGNKNIGSESWLRLEHIPAPAEVRLVELYRYHSSGSASGRKLLQDFRQIAADFPSMKRVDMRAWVQRNISEGVLPEGPLPQGLECEIALSAIDSGLEDEVYARLGEFNGSLEWIVNALLDSKGMEFAPKLLESLDRKDGAGLGAATGISAPLAERLIEGCVRFGEADVYVHEPALVALARHLDRVPEDGRGPVRKKLFDLLIKAARTDLIFTLIHAFPQAISPKSAEVVEALLSIPSHRAVKGTRVILEHLSEFPDEEHPAIVGEMVGRGGFELIKCVPVKLWQQADRTVAAMTLGRKYGAEKLAEHLEFFDKLGKEVANFLIENGCGGYVTWRLDRFTDLDCTTACALAKTGHVRQALSCFDSFAWTAPEFKEFVDIASETGGLDHLVHYLDRFPSRLLAAVEEIYHFEEFRRRCRVCTGETYNRFLTLKNNGNENAVDAFAGELSLLLDRVVSSSESPQLVKHPLYPAVVEYAYPDHSHRRDGIASSCEDRSSDLAGFKFHSRYKIDLSSGVKMVLKPGQHSDDRAIEKLLAPIAGVQSKLAAAGFEKDRMRQVLQEVIASADAEAAKEGSSEAALQVLALKAAADLHQARAFKEALLTYHFVEHENLAEYLQGTRDRATRAKTPGHAHLMLVREFFADRLRDTAVFAARKALASPHMPEVVDSFYAAIEKGRLEAERKDIISRARLEKLGATSRLHESLAAVLGNPALSSEKKLAALRSIVAGEQRKIGEALRRLGADPGEDEEIHLVKFRMEWEAAAVRKVECAALAPEHRQAYLTRIFDNLFAADLALIDREAAKFRCEAEGARGVRELELFFSKTKSSARARATAGVCVAIDNPSGLYPGSSSQWDMPNYFQLILRDPDSGRCAGLVLLHYYEIGGKKVLTASFNPCSTYLFKVDEEQLFSGLLACLAAFAVDNGIDIIGCSTSGYIRTNRTAGPFEMAMKRRINRVKKQFDLGEDRVFSYRPAYTQRTIDVLWERKGD